MIKQFFNSNIITSLLSLVVITIPLKSNINSISIILLALYSLFFLFKKRKVVIFKPSKQVIILITPFLFLLVQVFYSEWNSFSKNAIRSLPLIIFPFLFFYLKPWLKNKQIQIVLKTLVASAVIYSLFLLGVAFYSQMDYKPDFSTINWYFFTYYDFTEALDIHPTYLGMYLCIAFAVIFNQILLSRKRIVFNIFVLGFLGVVIFLSGSRIALVCLILITLNLLYFRINSIDIKTKIILLVVIVFTPILVFNFVPIVKERMIDMTFGLKKSYQYAKYGDNGKDNNYNGGLTPRFQIWSCAIEAGSYNYLFGSGFGKTQKKLNQCYLSKGLKTFADQNYQTHNQYFNNYTRGGLLSVFTLLLMYFYSLFFAYKKRNLLHLSLIIIIITTSLTENILNRQLGIVFFAFFNSLFFFSTNKIKYEG